MPREPWNKKGGAVKEQAEKSKSIDMEGKAGVRLSRAHDEETKGVERDRGN